MDPRPDLTPTPLRTPTHSHSSRPRAPPPVPTNFTARHSALTCTPVLATYSLAAAASLPLTRSLFTAASSSPAPVALACATPTARPACAPEL